MYHVSIFMYDLSGPEAPAHPSPPLKGNDCSAGSPALHHSSSRAKPKRIDSALKCQMNHHAKMIYIHLRMQLMLPTLTGLPLPPSESEITFVYLGRQQDLKSAQ